MKKSFYNLPLDAASPAITKSFFVNMPRKHGIQTNWTTFEDEKMTVNAMMDLFANKIPVVRQQGFLSSEECERMLEVLKTHKMGAYDLENTWPRLGSVGITNFDYISDQNQYLHDVQQARSLQARWKEEADIDILDRVATKIQEITNIMTRVAHEGDREYFAGIVRAADAGIAVHADWAPYETPAWSVGSLVGQLTWNILLNPVPGGETIIYDRQWNAPDDDLAWRKTIRADTYHKKMLEGRPFKVMMAVPGDLTFFNPRNFHEVLACDTSNKHPIAPIRFTVSSFIGYIPSNGSEPDTLVLWS
ncbi:hypothetical protein F4811DRAFT_531399 [Daldinia bambusicola]|nr:hypothetical protein F4811DRAFT_531399 [Daldinia bambusicola]